MTKKESGALVSLVLIGAVVWGVAKIYETVGFVIPAIIVVVCIGLYLWFKKIKEKERREFLLEKYGDQTIVEKLMNSTIWVGQTDDQLMDALGSPADIDQKVLKTKKKEVWKYHHKGGNRYGLRITLDDDEVVGWEEKL